jgi:hypothetical protein
MNPVSDFESFALHLQRRMHCNAGQTLLPEDEFNFFALQLFKLQYEQNPPYRNICWKQGISPDGLRHWSEIPAVPTSGFKELALSCIPANERTAVFFSSGTTEQNPSRHFHCKRSLEIYESSLLVWFRSHLLADVLFCESAPVLLARENQRGSALRVLALTPSQANAPHSSLVHMFDMVRRTLPFQAFTFTGKIATDGTWSLDYGATIQFLAGAISSNEPVLLLGTAFSYVHLLDYLAEKSMSLRLPAGSRVLETGGYKGRSRVLQKSELQEAMTNSFGIPPAYIISEYGMSELSSQAYDRVAGPDDYSDGPSPYLSRFFWFPPWARVQIISPENDREVSEGDAGLIRITDLANVYSVMAIQTEDLAIRRGKGFELIGRAKLAEQRGCSLMAHDEK